MPACAHATPPCLQAASSFGKFDKFSVRANATSREVIAGGQLPPLPLLLLLSQQCQQYPLL